LYMIQISMTPSKMGDGIAMFKHRNCNFIFL
jgi:hypothetical protein